MQRSIALLLLAAGCSNGTPQQAAPEPQPATPYGDVELQRASITAVVNSTRFVTREHFLAGGEMQISGEPLAQAMGRDLGSYNRNLSTPPLTRALTPEHCAAPASSLMARSSSRCPSTRQQRPIAARATARTSWSTSRQPRALRAARWIEQPSRPAPSEPSLIAQGAVRRGAERSV